MSNDKLLSDEELREYLASNGLPYNEVEGNMIIDLINTQKRLYAESVMQNHCCSRPTSRGINSYGIGA